MDRVGEYQLLEELAEAGTGRIYRAQRVDDPDGEPCAVKVIHDRFRRNSFYTATLFAEAPAARRFHHPVALGIYAVDDVDGALFVASELASGPNWRSLRERARAAGRTFSSDALLWMGRQVVGLLAAAATEPWAEGETEGLLVGQLAPQGVFVSKAGEVRISGLGLGRSRSCLPPTRSRLAYRAPELFAREPVRPATDVYGLGLVLYDALSGTEAFQREGVAEVKAAILEESLPPLEHIDPAVDALLRAMTSKDPAERPADLSEVDRLLGGALEREGSLVSAEWAEHVRVLFPELFEDRRAPTAVPPRRSRRVSVPYSQTAPTSSPNRSAPRSASRARPAPEAPVGPVPRPLVAAEPSLDPIPSSPARIATADLGPSTYDIEDLAELLASGVPPAARRRPPVRAEPPAGADAVGSADPVPAARALAALEDESERFDVDSVVDAIFARPTPSPPPPPGPPSMDLEPSPRLDAEGPSLDLADALESGDVDTAVVGRAPGGPPPSARGLSSPWSVPHVSETATAGEGKLRQSEALPPPPPPTVPPAEEPPPADPRLTPGDVLQDRYRIIEELGRGGMSIVYRAEHMLLLKEVALKLLRPELSTMRNVVERFQREARSVCRLDDPNIVRVTDFGRTPEGLLYLVMDLIRGRSLSSVIREEGRRPVREAISLVDQILAGLEHAHRFEVVHRDLKPENIMLVQRDSGHEVKILDFGIAKLGGGDEDQKSITQAGTVFGTPRYMSPEQAAGEPVDHRTDLYTVGVILYQLLTGRVPFHGETTVQLLAKVLTQAPPPMDFEAPSESVRAEIEAVTLRALSKEPEDRFESARAFREALDGCLLF